MAKKKHKIKVKLSKKQRLQLRAIGLPVVTGLVCLGLGIVMTRFIMNRQQPANLVWAAERSVKVPSDLREFLQSADDCREYRGTGSPTGVGLWGVYQVSKGKFAKIAYGCSWHLSSYIMAVKDDSGWRLLPTTEYFAPFANSNSTGALPLCKYIDLYQIDNSIESFCIGDDGKARANTIE